MSGIYPVLREIKICYEEDANHAVPITDFIIIINVCIIILGDIITRRDCEDMQWRAGGGGQAVEDRRWRTGGGGQAVEPDDELIEVLVTADNSLMMNALRCM